jgi:hypothetical protein
MCPIGQGLPKPDMAWGPGATYGPGVIWVFCLAPPA